MRVRNSLLHLRCRYVEGALRVDRADSVQARLGLHIIDDAHDTHGCFAAAHQAADRVRIVQDLLREALVHDGDWLTRRGIAICEGRPSRSRMPSALK